uniref:Uncharacterized protein n=1 Tax=Glossina pallidipes TaxID=7398 RepID=A0A1B0A663_GLOPL
MQLRQQKALLSTIIEEDDSENQDSDADTETRKNFINTWNTLRSPDTAVAEKPNKERSYQCTQAACFAGESSQITPYQEQPCLRSHELRCAAFGNFVASSLRDSTQNAALKFFGKLTSELVKSLLENPKIPMVFPAIESFLLIVQFAVVWIPLHLLYPAMIYDNNLFDNYVCLMGSIKNLQKENSLANLSRTFLQNIFSRIKIAIDNSKAITPLNLLGIDRKIA